MLQGSKKALKLLSFKAFFVVRGTGLEPTKRCFGLSLFMPASTIMWGIMQFYRHLMLGNFISYQRSKAKNKAKF